MGNEIDIGQYVLKSLKYPYCVKQKISSPKNIKYSLLYLYFVQAPAVFKDNGRKGVPQFVVCVADLEQFRTKQNTTSHLTFDLIYRITLLARHTRHCPLSSVPGHCLLCPAVPVISGYTVWKIFPLLDFHNDFGRFVKFWKKKIFLRISNKSRIFHFHLLHSSCNLRSYCCPSNTETEVCVNILRYYSLSSKWAASLLQFPPAVPQPATKYIAHM